MTGPLTQGEIRKDAVQGDGRGRRLAGGRSPRSSPTRSRDIAGAPGGLASELFEIRDSARRAAEDTDD